MQTLLWYLTIAGLGIAFLAAFRALAEEYVVKGQLDTEERLKEANATRQAQPEGVTMKDVRAHREAYRRALAGGLSGGSTADAARKTPATNQAPSSEP